jgi:glycine/D-amino acid oxidase-like deaminating enzyme
VSAALDERGVGGFGVPQTRRYDAIVVGGGHNGLVAAAYLSRAGRRVLVIERREILGGAAVSEEVWPGYTISTASYVCSLLHPQIVEDLGLRARGYDAYRKDPSSFTPLLDGRSLLVGRDIAENAREIAAFDRDDAFRVLEFELEAERLGGILYDAFERDDPSEAEIDDAARAAFAGSAADLVERYVSTPVLQATLATDGLIGTYAGPRDPGTGYVLAHHYAGRALGSQGAWGFVRGGMGAISRAIALAARGAGCAFRVGATVARILVRDGRAYGVALEDGTEFESEIVLSGADPVATFGSPARTRGAFSDVEDRRLLAQTQPRARRVAELSRATRNRSGSASPRDHSRRSVARLSASGARRRAPFRRIARADARVLHANADRYEPRAARQTRPLDLRAILSVRPRRRPVGRRKTGRGGGCDRRDARALCAQSSERRRSASNTRTARSRGALRVARRPHLPRGIIAGTNFGRTISDAHRYFRTVPLRFGRIARRLRQRYSGLARGASGARFRGRRFALRSDD